MTLAPQHQAAIDAAPPLDDEQAATITAIMRSVADAVDPVVTPVLKTSAKRATKEGADTL